MMAFADLQHSAQNRMRSPQAPTSEQAFECFRMCQQLTQMYLPIYLVRLDERTANVVVLAGEEIEILIDRNGESQIL